MSQTRLVVDVEFGYTDLHTVNALKTAKKCDINVIMQLRLGDVVNFRLLLAVEKLSYGEVFPRVLLM